MPSLRPHARPCRRHRLEPRVRRGGLHPLAALVLPAAVRVDGQGAGVRDEQARVERPSHLQRGLVSVRLRLPLLRLSLSGGARAPGDPCPRCGAPLDHNIEPRFAPAIAAVAAAIPLCLPAYDASVMINQNLTGILEHTVLGTVQLLADRGYWQLGVIVLVAGVAIPAVELLGMTWLLFRVRWPQKSGLVIRTRVYRILHRLVRWPMVIPFVAALAAPIIDYQGIDDIVAGPGATPLFAVIALAVFAVRMFEPRLMWKAGEVR